MSAQETIHLGRVLPAGFVVVAWPYPKLIPQPYIAPAAKSEEMSGFARHCSLREPSPQVQPQPPKNRRAALFGALSPIRQAGSAAVTWLRESMARRAAPVSSSLS